MAKITPNALKWTWLILLILAELALIAVYILLSATIVRLDLSQALAILALIVFNVGVYQIFSAVTRVRELHAAAAPPAGTPPPDPTTVLNPLWKPGYSFLLAVGLFALALAMYEPPMRLITGESATISLLPATSGSNAVTPSATPAPLACGATLRGLDTLTPGSAAIYHVAISCGQPAQRPFAVELERANAIGTPEALYTAVTQDGGKTYDSGFLVQVPSATTATGVIHTVLVSRIKTSAQNGTSDQMSPVLGITIKPAKTLDDAKGVITNLAGVLAALMSLFAGLAAFLKGQARTP